LLLIGLSKAENVLYTVTDADARRVAADPAPISESSVI
jgi:hypothetical protein